MERFAQYLDELEDLVCAIWIVQERLIRAVRITFVLFTSFLLQLAGVLLALARPPLALAAVSLMIVGMLYNSATSRSPAAGLAA